MDAMLDRIEERVDARVKGPALAIMRVLGQGGSMRDVSVDCNLAPNKAASEVTRIAQLLELGADNPSQALDMLTTASMRVFGDGPPPGELPPEPPKPDPAPLLDPDVPVPLVLPPDPPNPAPAPPAPPEPPTPDPVLPPALPIKSRQGVSRRKKVKKAAKKKLAKTARKKAKSALAKRARRPAGFTPAEWKENQTIMGAKVRVPLY